MKKKNAVILAAALVIVLAFWVAVSVFAVKKIIEVKDFIVEVISAELEQIEVFEQSEKPITVEQTEPLEEAIPPEQPTEPVTGEQTEPTEEPIPPEQPTESVTDEQTEPSEEPFTSEQAEAPTEQNDPVQEEDLSYFGYLKKHATKGFENLKTGIIGTLLIPVALLAGLFPVYGWMVLVFCLCSPFIAVFGFGELIFSPIIAAVEFFF